MNGLGNKNQIVYIEICPQKPSDKIIYKNKKTFLWLELISEGFHSNENNILKKVINVPEGMLVNGKMMIIKAHLIIEFSSGRKITEYFNSNEEMYIYLKREFQGREWKEYNNE